MDTAPIAWVTTGAYLASALGCAWALRAARIGAIMSREARPVERRQRDRASAYRASFAFWTLLLLGMVVLGINKPLDLHFALTRVLRDLAAEQGWYKQRQPLQAVVAGTILLGGLAVLAVLLRRTRELLPRHALAFAGVVLLSGFLAARTVSFHHLDAWLYRPVAGLETQALLELAGILAVGGCAWTNARWCGVRDFLGRGVQSDRVSDDSRTAMPADRFSECP